MLEGPVDDGPLAQVEVEHGEQGTYLSPWAWAAIFGVLVLTVGLLAVLL